MVAHLSQHELENNIKLNLITDFISGLLC
jgi:hypothetical protein